MMDRFYGFDLGDGESALALLNKGERGVPLILTVDEARSFITAYAVKNDGALLIGEKACYEADVICRKERFKSRFLSDPEAFKDIAAFAGGLLGRLHMNGEPGLSEGSCFYVGCPAGWNRNAREEYRLIFEKCGYPPVKIVSESRAALVSACQSKHLQVGYDILHKPVLVIDIGSSTTDFAYIEAGHEVELKTGGEVALGGGIMDEILLDIAVEKSPDRKRIREIFRSSPPWQSCCDFAARRLKEKYFTDEAYWSKHECLRTIRIKQGLIPLKLTLCLDADIACELLNRKVKKLNNYSFREVFNNSLAEVKKATSANPPQLIFLTGGVSRLSAVSQWCRKVFPDAVVINAVEPEFSVARGLAYCGRIDEELREFKDEIDQLVHTSTVERIVGKHIDDLYKSVVKQMVEPILANCAVPAVEKWRLGRIKRLADMDEVLKEDIESYLHTDDARQLIMKPVSTWLKKISYELEEHTIPICVRHNIPYQALSLNTYLSLSELGIEVAAKDLFAVREITWLIDTTISLIVGLICGGSGIALVSSGLEGILAGMIISFMVLTLGKQKMEEFMLKADMPKILRRMIPKTYIKGRMDVISVKVKDDMLKMLEEDKNEEIITRVNGELSEEIEQCLIKMAAVVEIPLGS